MPQIQFRRAQQKIIDHVLDRLFIKDEKGAAVFAKIGSGKTLSSLEIFKQLRDLGVAKRALVVAPLRPLARTWPDEIKQWRYDYKHVKVNGKMPNPTTYDMVFCSPDSLHKVIDAAEAGMFDLLIVDESQRFQNFTTKRMKFLKKILPHIPKRVILTATPCANRLTQLFSQIYIVDDGEALGKNVTVCRNKFTDKGGFKGRQHIFRADKEKEVLDLIAPYTVYVDEADIDFDYPKRVVNDLICPLDAVTRHHQNTLKNDLYVALASGETLTADNAAAAYNSLKQLASGFLYGENKEVKTIHKAKLDALESVANESSGQVLIFYWHTANLESIVKKLGPANCAWTAGKSDKLANAEIDKWMAHKKQFLLGNWVSMGEGLNLQAPDHSTLVAYELPESGTPYEQGIGRLQRPGGASHLFLHRILLEESIDQVILERLCGRLDNQDAFLSALKDWASK